MIRLGGNLLLIVQKYGGTSVADKKRIMNAASRIAEAYRSGNRLVVVVSAQGSTTDELITVSYTHLTLPTNRLV